MSSLTRFINPFIQYLDNNGVPLVGGQLFSYESGTDAFMNTYSDSALTVPNPNPIVLDSGGRVPYAIFLTTGTYKFVLEDINNNVIGTADPNAGMTASGGSLPTLSNNAADFGKTIQVTADGSNYELTTILNNTYTIASALATSGAILTLKDEGASGVNNAHPFIQFGESNVVGGTQTNMGIIGYSTGITNPVVFTGSGLNDAASGGTETSGRPHTYTVIIDATGMPDTFKWQVDSGSFATGVAILGVAQTLVNGVTIKFNATTGHTLGDQWVFQTGESLNIKNTISGGNINIATTGTGKIYLNGGTYPLSFLPVTITTSQTWFAPSDSSANTLWKVTTTGPGGSSGGCANTQVGGSGAGGGVVIYEAAGIFTANTGYAAVIGAAGPAGVSGSNSGTSGSNTTFVTNNGTITANAGNPGIGSSNGTVALGGTGTGPTGSIIFQGNPGTPPSISDFLGGAGGTAWGSAGGGAGGNSTSNATAGTARGAGGGSNGITAAAGTLGFRGEIFIERLSG